jgi:hypothetical protein
MHALPFGAVEPQLLMLDPDRLELAIGHEDQSLLKEEEQQADQQIGRRQQQQPDHDAPRMTTRRTR